MTGDRPRLAATLRTGLTRGGRTGWFLVRIIIPLSAAVALLQWTGILDWIASRIAPVMGIVGLPGEASIVLVSGFATGVYGGVAAAAVIPLTAHQMTIVALIILICHNLFVESAVQSRSGASGLKVSAVRMATALGMGFLLWQVLRWGDQGAAVVAQKLVQGREETFALFLSSWAQGAFRLTLKILIIVVSLMVATELMRAYGVIDALVRPMRPVMRFLGLSERVTLLWLTGIFLGIAYGAGLIIEDARERHRFQPGDLRDLHVSLGVNHSVLEDPLLFAAIGANVFWCLAPRPFAAALVVRAVRRLVPSRPVEASPEPPAQESAP
jgi:spore maturation protein SpmB